MNIEDLLLDSTDPMQQALILKHRELLDLRKETGDMKAALTAIVEHSDCKCQHDTEDCCANVAPLVHWCPGCVAAKTLKRLEYV